MSAVAAGICFEADPTVPSDEPGSFSYVACALPAGHRGGHRWEKCGVSYVVRMTKGRDVVEVVIKCTRNGHAGLHAFEWEQQ